MFCSIIGKCVCILETFVVVLLRNINPYNNTGRHSQNIYIQIVVALDETLIFQMFAFLDG